MGRQWHVSWDATPLSHVWVSVSRKRGGGGLCRVPRNLRLTSHRYCDSDLTAPVSELISLIRYCSSPQASSASLHTAVLTRPVLMELPVRTRMHTDAHGCTRMHCLWGVVGPQNLKPLCICVYLCASVLSLWSATVGDNSAPDLATQRGLKALKLHLFCTSHRMWDASRNKSGTRHWPSQALLLFSPGGLFHATGAWRYRLGLELG